MTKPDEIVLYSTDRFIQRSRFYAFRKKYMKPSYILCILFVVTIFAMRLIFREIPPTNVIRHISYRRNRIKIMLQPETVVTEPVYEFGRLSENEYFLDVSDSHIQYEYERQYEFGDVSRIARQRLDKGINRLVFTFSALKDTPDVAYINDPPHFDIHFNRYLDDTFIVVIDPGHGGSNTGGIGSTGVMEKKITLAIALRLHQYLNKKEKVKVFLTRTEDQDVGLHERRRLSNFWESDLFISIHTNHARNKKANHTEIYYASTHSLPTARIFRDKLQETLSNGRGLIRRRGFAVIRGNTARMGAVLVEIMFLSNKAGEKFLTNSKNQDTIAQSLYQSIDHVLRQAKE